MKRRGFLKLLGLAAVTSVVAKEVVVEKTKIELSGMVDTVKRGKFSFDKHDDGIDAIAYQMGRIAGEKMDKAVLESFSKNGRLVSVEVRKIHRAPAATFKIGGVNA